MKRLVAAGRMEPRKIGGSFQSTGTKVRVIEAFGELPDGFRWTGTQYVTIGAPPYASSYALEKLLRQAANLAHEEWKR